VVIDNEKLQSSLTKYTLEVIETKNLNLVISQSSNIIVLNQNGDIINVFKDTDAKFKGVCTDNYGNIFVADYESQERVIMLSEDGILKPSFIWINLSGARTPSPSGAPEFIPGFLLGSCYSIFSFICMFCRSLFVLLYVFFWPYNTV
jgi:hypothetical protein